MAMTKQKSKPAKITQKSKPIVTAAPAVVMAAAEMNRAGVKSMVPRSFDKFTGSEPTWDKPALPENRQASLIKAFNWYNYSYGKKEAHDFVIDWLHRSGRIADAKLFRTVPDKQIINTMGWLCRMNVAGLALSATEQERIAAYVTKCLAAPKSIVKTVDKLEVPAITIQDRLRAKVGECAGELEGMFDEFIIKGCKLNADYKPVAAMRSMNIAPQMVGDIATIWKSYLKEFEEVANGKDADLVEGYSNFNKVQLKNIIKFAELVITDCGAYVQIKKVERKPRKKKAMPPERQVAKFKYLKAFPELKLVSENATRLVNASEAWLFDVKKRKLIHVVADSHLGTFGVKNNSIVGYSTAETQQKTLRKPAEQIKALLTGGKPGARKVFKEIKATETKFNGRGTDNLIILRAS